MLFLKENCSLYLWFLPLIACSISIYFYVNYRYYKIAEKNNLIYLNNQIIAEKITSEKLKKVDQTVVMLSKKTDLKIRKIKVIVFNIDFTLKELLYF